MIPIIFSGTALAVSIASLIISLRSHKKTKKTHNLVRTMNRNKACNYKVI